MSWSRMGTGWLTVEVQQAEPESEIGAELATLTLSATPNAEFSIVRQEAGAAGFALALVGTNPAKVVATRDLIQQVQGGADVANEYGMLVEASDPTNGFRGTLTLSVQVLVTPGNPITLTDERAARLEDRFATIYVAENHTGALYTLTLRSGVNYNQIFNPAGLLSRRILDGRGLEVYLPRGARLLRDLTTSNGRVILACQTGIPCVPEGGAYDPNAAGT